METAQLSFLPPQEPQADTRVDAPLDARTSLHRAAEAFHAHLISEERSLNTIRAFDSDLRLLQSYLGTRAVIGHIRHADLDSFVRYLRQGRGVRCNAKSLSRRVTTLRVFFGWLTDTRVVSSDPAALLTHPRVATPLPRVLSASEVNLLLAATEGMRTDTAREDARPHVLATLLLSTGIKKGECMALTVLDIDPSDSEGPSVFIHYDTVRHRHKERRLRLPAGFGQVLEEYLRQYQPASRLFECSARNLEYVLDQASRRAGLPARRACFEVLRYTCALRDLRDGVEPDTLRRKLGVSEITWIETLAKLQRLNTPVI